MVGNPHTLKADEHWEKWLQFYEKVASGGHRKLLKVWVMAPHRCAHWFIAQAVLDLRVQPLKRNKRRFTGDSIGWKVHTQKDEEKITSFTNMEMIMMIFGPFLVGEVEVPRRPSMRPKSRKRQGSRRNAAWLQLTSQLGNGTYNKGSLYAICHYIRGYVAMMNWWMVYYIYIFIFTPLYRRFKHLNL